MFKDAAAHLSHQVQSSGKKTNVILAVVSKWKLTLCCYLLLLVRSSVPLVQSTVAFGAARGWHGMMTFPLRAAGISRFTGFSLKSGAKATAGGKKDD